MISLQPIDQSAFHSKKIISKSPTEIIVEFENSGKLFSLKRIFLEEMAMVNEDKKKEYIERTKRESEILMGKNLRNVLKIHGYFNDLKRKEFHIVMDECGVSLRKYILNQERRNFQIVYHILLGILKGINKYFLIDKIDIRELKF